TESFGAVESMWSAYRQVPASTFPVTGAGSTDQFHAFLVELRYRSAVQLSAKLTPKEAYFYDRRRPLPSGIVKRWSGVNSRNDEKAPISGIASQPRERFPSGTRPIRRRYGT